jgi:hypothetical protein
LSFLAVLQTFKERQICVLERSGFLTTCDPSVACGKIVVANKVLKDYSPVHATSLLIDMGFGQYKNIDI